MEHMAVVFLSPWWWRLSGTTVCSCAASAASDKRSFTSLVQLDQIRMIHQKDPTRIFQLDPTRTFLNVREPPLSGTGSHSNAAKDTVCTLEFISWRMTPALLILFYPCLDTSIFGPKLYYSAGYIGISPHTHTLHNQEDSTVIEIVLDLILRPM